MNEGRLSSELLEVASQGGSSVQFSNEVTEVITQSAVASEVHQSVMVVETVSQLPTPSAIHISSVVVEVLRQVPVMRVNLTPVLN